jgi:hypothetical protein
VSRTLPVPVPLWNEVFADTTGNGRDRDKKDDVSGDCEPALALAPAPTDEDRDSNRLDAFGGVGGGVCDGEMATKKGVPFSDTCKYSSMNRQTNCSGLVFRRKKV